MDPKPLTEGMLVRCENRNRRHYEGLYLKWHGERLCPFCVHEDGSPIDAMSLHVWCTSVGGHYSDDDIPEDGCARCGLTGKTIRVLQYRARQNPPQGRSDTFATARGITQQIVDERATLLAHITRLQEELAEKQSCDCCDEEDDLENLARELFMTDPDVLAHVDQQMDVGLVKTAEQWGIDMASSRARGLEIAWALSIQGDLVAECHPLDSRMMKMPTFRPKHPKEHAWRVRAEERARMIVRMRALDAKLRATMGDDIPEVMYKDSPFFKAMTAKVGTLFGVDSSADPTRLAGLKFSDWDKEKLEASIEAIKKDIEAAYAGLSGVGLRPED